jgi:putative endonuclease
LFMYFVYILWSQSAAKTYVGFSANPELRLLFHNEKATKGWTIRHRPWIIVELFPFEDKKQAMENEKYFKTGAGRDEIQRLLKNKGLKS